MSHKVYLSDSDFNKIILTNRKSRWRKALMNATVGNALVALEPKWLTEHQIERCRSAYGDDFNEYSEFLRVLRYHIPVNVLKSEVIYMGDNIPRLEMAFRSYYILIRDLVKDKFITKELARELFQTILSVPKDRARHDELWSPVLGSSFNSFGFPLYNLYLTGIIDLKLGYRIAIHTNDIHGKAQFSTDLHNEEHRKQK